MGFQEAISRSGWDSTKQVAALALCDRIRDCLGRTDFRADPDRVYNNLNSDPSIPDGPVPGHPTSRREFLDELLGKGPTLTGDELKDAVAQFCRRHKQEGPDDGTAQGRVLGRVWAFEKLQKAFLLGRLGRLRRKNRLHALIERGTFERQRAELGKTELASKLMWAFYDPGDATEPFASLTHGAANMLDRLGLGDEWKRGGKLVKWGIGCPQTGRPIRQRPGTAAPTVPGGSRADGRGPFRWMAGARRTRAFAPAMGFRKWFMTL